VSRCRPTFEYTPAAGTVLHAGAGQELSVTFTPDDTDNYLPATKTVHITVTKAGQHITFTSAPPTAATVGGPAYEVAAVSDSGLPVTLSIDPSASSVCALSGSTVTFTGAGTCKISADQGGSDDYAAAPQATQSFAVGGNGTKLVAARAIKTLFGLLPTRFSATLTRADDNSAIADQTITFAVRGKTVCSAPTNAAGTATCSGTIGLISWLLADRYTATFAGSSSYLPSSATGVLGFGSRVDW
jgi:hypothetical protein